MRFGSAGVTSVAVITRYTGQVRALIHFIRVPNVRRAGSPAAIGGQRMAGCTAIATEAHAPGQGDDEMGRGAVGKLRICLSERIRLRSPLRSG